MKRRELWRSLVSCLKSNLCEESFCSNPVLPDGISFYAFHIILRYKNHKSPLRGSTRRAFMKKECMSGNLRPLMHKNSKISESICLKVPGKPCHGGPHHEPFRARYRGWHPDWQPLHALPDQSFLQLHRFQLPLSFPDFSWWSR